MESQRSELEEIVFGLGTIKRIKNIVDKNKHTFKYIPNNKQISGGEDCWILDGDQFGEFILIKTYLDHSDYMNLLSWRPSKISFTVEKHEHELVKKMKEEMNKLEGVISVEDTVAILERLLNEPKI